MEEIIFPNQIRMLRKAKGYNMQELADHLGVSLSAISKIEKGYRRIDQEQLVKVADFLDCPLQDVFVNEQNSQPEVVAAWRSEQDRRNKINETTGLKVLGAALRYIRGQKRLTLAEVAENSEMTLSVYHRIEMGQREVSDKEYASMAKALQFPSKDELEKQIRKLDGEGVLNELIQRVDARYRNVGIRGAGYGEYFSSIPDKRRKQPEINVYGKPAGNGDIIVNKNEPVSTIPCPLNLTGKEDVYAINLCSRRLGNILPTRCVLFVDPNEMVSLGDIALYCPEDSDKVKVLSIREDETGKLYGIQLNPEEKVDVEESFLHRVIMIAL